MRNRIPRKIKKRLRDSASPRFFGLRLKRKNILLNAARAYFVYLFKRRIHFYYNFGFSYQCQMLDFFGL